MSRLGVATALLVICLGCGRTHIQEEGAYDFRATEVIRDECGLLPGGAGPMWGGKLILSGDLARLNDDLFGIEMVGAFLVREEAFTADGSAANVTTDVNGKDCLVDLVNLHMDAQTVSATEMTGTMRISFETQYQSACACQTWLSFRATRDLGTPAAP